MLSRVREKVGSFIAIACISVLSFCVLAFAGETGGTTVDVSSLIGTAATSAVNQANSTISTLIPIVLALIGTVIAVKLGIRLFKSFTNKA